jgi:hypothetical protein
MLRGIVEGSRPGEPDYAVFRGGICGTAVDAMTPAPEMCSGRSEPRSVPMKGLKDRPKSGTEVHREAAKFLTGPM